MSLAPTPLDPNPCFIDSRRLTGPNRYFRETAVVLEPIGPGSLDYTRHEDWRRRITHAWLELGWGSADALIHRHASGVILICKAPWYALFTATEVNEWAWEQASGWFFTGVSPVEAPAETAALFDNRPIDALQPLAPRFEAVKSHFAARALAEQRPALTALEHAARVHGVDCLADDETVSLGSGVGMAGPWPIDRLPEPHELDFAGIADIPRALVTGSNGKTTTVRLIAAMAKQAGHVPGYSCTEGVYVNGALQDGGDYSGPGGARVVLRNRAVGLAVLETARGGIARRGLAVERADVTVVTNISADHFGEYGIDSLIDLARIKLAVARVVNADGLLVLNADDATLMAALPDMPCPVGLFAQSFQNPHVVAKLECGGVAVAIEDGHLLIRARTYEYDLGRVVDMPITVGGAARYNIENAMAAALAAYGLGLPSEAIRHTLLLFGQQPADNAGRLERYEHRGATVLIDYAHNPEGYRGLVAVGRSIANPRGGRIAIMIGHAGNRTDDAIAEVARCVAGERLDFVVVKEISAMLRGRPPGEVSGILTRALVAAGHSAHDAVAVTGDNSEVEAANQLLEWVKPGDVVLLPVHQKAAREVIRAGLVGVEQQPSP